MIYMYPIKGKRVFVKRKFGDFCSPFSEREKQSIVNYFYGNTSDNLYNGVNVRLDQISEEKDATVFEISLINFYDLITTNLLLMNYQVWAQKANKKEKKLLLREVELYKKDGHPQNMIDILKRPYLSGATAISVMINDEQGNYLMVHRNQQVAISKGMMSVAITGAVDETDFVCVDPILSCVIRETREELGLSIHEDDISVRMIVAGKNKLQPIILCDIHSNTHIRQLIQSAREIGCYAEENNDLVCVSKHELTSILEKYRVTEAAEAHINLHIKQNHE